MHARFHDRVGAVIDETIAGLSPGAERLFRGSEAYLDVSLANRGVKALALEARSDPSVQGSMEARRQRPLPPASPTWRPWAGTTPRRRPNCLAR